MVCGTAGYGFSEGWERRCIEQGDSLSARTAVSLEREQLGGVQQEGIQVLSMDGPMERRLWTTPLNFWQQVLHLLYGHKDLRNENHKEKSKTDNIRIKYGVDIIIANS